MKNHQLKTKCWSIYKRQRKPKGQPIMENPETNQRDGEKQTHKSVQMVNEINTSPINMRN